MKFKLLLFITLFASQAFGQGIFKWNSKKDKIEIPFQLTMNLIVLPIELNNVKLNMLLDTGAENSMIFSLPVNDSLHFDTTKKLKIKGLGSDEEIDALYSSNNHLNILGYENKEFPILIILNQEVNISSRLGIEVNGILNSSFFQNRLIEIDYIKKKLVLHKSRDFLSKRKIKKYTSIPLKIIKKRPYVDIETKIEDVEMNLNLLVDLGLSDGLWLFENDKIKIKPLNFEDILGRGLNGYVLGKKSRVDIVKISNYQFKDALVSYPYKNFLPTFGISQGRNGSIGGGLLYRFNVIFDFEERQLLLKPNSKFSESFNYNMSGMEVQHNGIQFVEETVTMKTADENASRVDNYVNGNRNYFYRFTLKPVFEIATIRKNSPADLTGLLESDKIIRINKKKIYQYSLQQINELFQSEEGKWIYIDIERNGVPIAFKFQLKKII